jgi:ATP-dependent Lhr-like helicase
MGVGCGDPFLADEFYAEVQTAAPYADLTREDFDLTVDFVSTGGYALKSYDRFRRIVQGPDGRWRVRNAQTALRHRLNVGAIIGPSVLNVRLLAGRRAGRKIGEVEEGYLEVLEVGDTFLFAGQCWALVGVTGMDVLVRPAPDTNPKMPSWGGSKFALSTFLAAKVRHLMSDGAHWDVLPDDVREWLEIQRDRSAIPAEHEMLLETFPHQRRFFMVAYAFEGRLAHTTLAMLLTRRLERAGVGPIGFTCNDYAVAIWSMHDMAGLDLGDLFAEDMLGDDLESWLLESTMMKAAFKACALISGLVERRFRSEQKSGRAVTFSTDLVYDVLRRHQPDHLLLRCARADAAKGLVDVARLGQLLTRIKGRIRHAALDHLSPFSVPMILEIGRQASPGRGTGDMILAEAADELIAQATR